LDDAMNLRVVELEKIDHDHTNKAVLDGITSVKVANWDAAEQNAKSYTDGQIGAAKTELSGTITTLETQLDGRLDAAESDIDTLQSDVIKAKSVVSSNDTSIDVTPETAEDGHVEYKLSLKGIATDSALSALQGKVETLIGDADAEKSVRTIVKEEIDAQLDPDNLTEALLPVGFHSPYLQKNPYTALPAPLKFSPAKNEVRFLTVLSLSALYTKSFPKSPAAKKGFPSFHPFLHRRKPSLPPALRFSDTQKKSFCRDFFQIFLITIGRNTIICAFCRFF
jgi:hypothetical protein